MSLIGKREKVFGMGRPLPLDRNAKARIMFRARAMMRRTIAGKAYGAITAKTYAVLGALLYRFHNSRSGLCFPSYEAIADAASCSRSTVANALAVLEEVGLLSWVNRLTRVADHCIGKQLVLRTSNAYRFNDPGEGCPSAKCIFIIITHRPNN